MEFWHSSSQQFGVNQVSVQVQFEGPGSLQEGFNEIQADERS